MHYCYHENNKGEKHMKSFIPRFLAIIPLFCLGRAFCQQQIVLVGTSHSTPESQLVHIHPIRDAIISLKPDIICIEYPRPTDTISVKYFHGEDIVERQKYLRDEWNIPANAGQPEIQALTSKLKTRNDFSCEWSCEICIMSNLTSAMLTIRHFSL